MAVFYHSPIRIFAKSRLRIKPAYASSPKVIPKQMDKITKGEPYHRSTVNSDTYKKQYRPQRVHPGAMLEREMDAFADNGRFAISIRQKTSEQEHDGSRKNR